jgi:quercetin dioxygenase-like cupin family protein
VDIRRFGYGHRRPDGPAGTHGVQAALIHTDGRGTITELALARKSLIEPHVNPNTTWFVVIEGGGFVRVGDETVRVFAGEAVLWPAGVVHGASTDVSEMRAIVVELAGDDDSAVRGILEGAPLALDAGPVAKGEGALVHDHPDHGYDPAEGEPV